LGREVKGTGEKRRNWGGEEQAAVVQFFKIIFQNPCFYHRKKYRNFFSGGICG